MKSPEQPLTFHACKVPPLGPTLRVSAKVKALILLTAPTVPVAVGLGPATVALHPGPVTLAMMPLIVIVVLVVVGSQDWAFSSHGWLADADVVTVNVLPPGRCRSAR